MWVKVRVKARVWCIGNTTTGARLLRQHMCAYVCVLVSSHVVTLPPHRLRHIYTVPPVSGCAGAWAPRRTVLMMVVVRIVCVCVCDGCADAMLRACTQYGVARTPSTVDIRANFNAVRGAVVVACHRFRCGSSAAGVECSC